MLRLSVAAVVVAIVLLAGSKTTLGGFIFSFGPGTVWHDRFCFRDEICRSGDFDGDGKDDVATFLRSSQPAPDEGDVYVALSDGASFKPDPGNLWHEDFCYLSEFCDIGDFDGDGKDDIVTFVHDSATVYVGVSTGTSFGPGTIWQVFSTCTSTLQTCTTGDFNGDGKDDIVAFVPGTGLGADAYVALSAGSSFEDPTLWLESFCVTGQTCDTGDFDGDGDDDILAVSASGGLGGGTRVALSDGTSAFSAARGWGTFLTCDQGSACGVGNFDGDGKSDLVRFLRGTSGDVEVYHSTGSEFFYSGLFHEDFCFGEEICDTGDFDGNGDDDIVTFLRSSRPAPDEGDAYVALSRSFDVLTHGDIDCNDTINGVDALRAILAKFGLALPAGVDCPAITSGSPMFGDVNCSGAIDELDALAILAHAAGTPIDPPDECPAVGQILLF